MTLPTSLSKALRWFTGLPLTIVATQPLLFALVLSSTEAAGWNDWGISDSLRPLYRYLHGRWPSDALGSDDGEPPIRVTRLLRPRVRPRLLHLGRT